MRGSVASSPQRTLERIWTSPCRHSRGWGQRWDLSDPFRGRCGGSWLWVPGSIAHSDGPSYFGGRPYPWSPHPRSPPMRVLTVLGLLAGGIGSLNAQRGGQVEIGGFGSYTRGDSPLPPGNPIRAGGRLRLFFLGPLHLPVGGKRAPPPSPGHGGGE